jgi:hypothetical protein
MASGTIARRLAIVLVSSILFAQNSKDLIVRIEVNLVQVDAVVVDSKGQQVTDRDGRGF